MVFSDKGTVSLIVDGSVYEVLISTKNQETKDKSFSVTVNGCVYEIKVEDQKSLIRRSLSRARGHSATVLVIKAPMPGKVVRVEVEQGASIKTGTGLIVLEAMKMENEIKSATEGVVERIHVGAGEAVEKGEVLVSIKPN